jgi:hypothetical protein
MDGMRTITRKFGGEQPERPYPDMVSPAVWRWREKKPPNETDQTPTGADPAVDGR